jgi:death-on-curing protein
VKDIRFILIDEVLEIHESAVREYGGESGIRDWDRLLSALDQPKAGTGGGYFHKNLFEMAAAYMFYIIKDHPFVDANKRVGVMLAIQFLALNDIEVITTNDELQRIAEKTATGEIEKSEIAHFLRVNSRPADE